MNIRMPTREEIHTAYEKGEEAVVELFGRVGEQMEVLAKHLEAIRKVFYAAKRY